MKRRKFIATAGAAGFAAISYNRIHGANDRLQMALVGSGRRGRLVMGKMLETGRAEIRMICDAWDRKRVMARETLALKNVRETVALESSRS